VPEGLELLPMTLKESNLDFKKDDVSTLKCDLYNLNRCLREAFRGLKIIDNQDVILAIGNTGAGKSTMLTSLVFGKEHVKLTQIIT
jgi:ABC-type uncharacterized transport system ATPase component